MVADSQEWPWLPEAVQEDEDEGSLVEHVAGQQERLFRKVWNVKVVVLEDQVDQHHPEVDHDTLGIAGCAG